MTIQDWFPLGLIGWISLLSKGLSRVFSNTTVHKYQLFGAQIRSRHLVPLIHGKYMRKQWKQWQILFWGGSKITADGDCCHEIKRCLLLGRKVMTNLYSKLKSRDITLPTKVCLVKAMIFPIVTCGCESWTVKKAEWLWARHFLPSRAFEPPPLPATCL